MSGAGPPPRRSSSMAPKRSSTVRRSSAPPSENGNAKPSSPNSSVVWERTVKKLRLSKALTIPEGTSVSDACKRMAARRVDAVLLTDSNALLSGIVTDKDIITRVLAEELKPEETTISKVMTRNPIFVNSDSLAIDALQKMVQGKFRHLPVVENGEVIAMLDITKCLYDAISRMEKAAEQGSAIAAAVEGVERQFGSNLSASSAFIETLRERMFKPSLSSIISENSRFAVVEPSDSVQDAAKRMRDLRVNSVLIMTENNILGILTSKDILLRVLAQNLPPVLTLVEKVMTLKPECVTLETTILEALHIMHDGKFLHLPVVDKDGNVATCLDVLQITHAAISMVESGSGAANDVANTVMQNFWDTAINMEPPEDYDTQSDMSISQYLASEGAEHAKPAYPSLGLGNSFSFKFKDREGRVHRFNMGTENLAELISAVMQRVGASNDQSRPQLTYEDDEGDKVLLTTDGDLASAVTNARAAGVKVLRLQLDYVNTSEDTRKPLSDAVSAEKAGSSASLSLHYGILAGAIVVTSIGVLIYLKRKNI